MLVLKLIRVSEWDLRTRGNWITWVESHGKYLRNYRQSSNVSGTLIGNKSVDHSDVVN